MLRRLVSPASIFDSERVSTLGLRSRLPGDTDTQISSYCFEQKVFVNAMTGMACALVSALWKVRSGAIRVALLFGEATGDFVTSHMSNCA